MGDFELSLPFFQTKEITQSNDDVADGCRLCLRFTEQIVKGGGEQEGKFMVAQSDNIIIAKFLRLFVDASAV